MRPVQLFSPYGSVRYSWGSMPTTYNFTGQTATLEQAIQQALQEIPARP